MHCRRICLKRAPLKPSYSFTLSAASHFGGEWEIKVCSFETNVTLIIGNQIVRHDEFSTLMVQIEALLNCRPLYEVSSDPNDTSVLTPGHCLTHEPLTSLPELQNLENINCLHRWQLEQKFIVTSRLEHANHIEYLHNLNQRERWHNSKIRKIRRNQK